MFLTIFLALTPVYLYIIHYYVKFYFKWRHGPPGPIPLPLFGNLWQLSLGPKKGADAISHLSKKHGDIFRLTIGIKDFVVVSSIDTLTDILNRDEAIGRDFYSGLLHERASGKNTGIISAEGNIWKTNRAWTFKSLHKLGLSKNSGIVGRIQEQCNEIISTWKKLISDSGRNKNWVEVEVNHFTLLLQLTKLLFKLVSGYRISDQVLIDLLEKHEIISRDTNALAVAYPLLNDTIPQLTGKWLRVELYELTRSIVQKIVDEVRNERKSFIRTEDKTLIHTYLDSIDKNKEGVDSSDFNFAYICMDLLQAGSTTSSGHIRSLLIHCVIYPEWQNIMLEEMNKVIHEDEEEVKVEYLSQMPYTEAFMLEVHRMAITVQNLLPHRIMAEFKHGNYVIPKDTILIADLYSAHFDSRIWENPSKFDPTRFFTPGRNEICLKKRRQILPFGAGKRRCPGENVAEMTSFIFLVNILRNFKLGVVPGEAAPIMEMSDEVTSAPIPFKMTVSLR